MKRKSRIFVISAPSGSGKTTICNEILKRIRGIVPSTSLTTRPPRPGERNKKDYYYVSEKYFRDQIKKERLLEWEENFGNLYGTPKGLIKEAFKKGEDILLSIDVKGAMQVKKKLKESILIFVKPPSFKELERRLKSRNTDKKEDMRARLKTAKTEFAYIPKYDYVVVNTRLKDAVNEVISIIKKERKG